MLISYQHLGTYGRLGNQLWQIASTVGIAEQLGAEVSFNPWPSRKCFSLPEEWFDDRIGEPAWNYLSEVHPDHRIYMQYYPAWSATAARVHQMLQPSSQFLGSLHKKNPEIFSIDKELRLGIHIRRADYLQLPSQFSRLSQGYFRRAVGMFPWMTPIVFSDDQAWCREHFSDWRIGPEGNTPEEDLVLLANCHRHILSASTYSWWGAFLSDDRTPLYPSPWFGPALRMLRPEHVILPTWIPFPIQP